MKLQTRHLQVGIAIAIITVVFPISLISQNYGDFKYTLQPDIRISGYGNHGTFIQTDPAVASNGINGFLVVWQDDRNGYEDIWGVRLDQNGVSSGSNFRVTTDDANRTKTNPVCAMSASGQMMVLWTSNNSVYGKCYTSDMQVVTDEFRIHPTGVYGQQSALTLTSDGGFMGAVSDDNSDRIHLQRFNGTGARVGDLVQVYDGDCGDIINIQLLFVNNTLFLSWVEDDWGLHSHFLMSLNLDLTVRGGAVQLRASDSSADCIYDMVPDGSGNLILFYPQQEGVKSSILRTTRDPDCVEVGAPQIVSPETGMSFHSPRVVKRNGNSTQLAVLLGSPQRGQLATMQFADGAAARDHQVVGDVTGSFWTEYSKRNVAISRNSGGRQLLVFSDARNHLLPRISNDQDVFGQLLLENGAKTGSNFRLGDDEMAEVDLYPSVSLSTSNRKTIVWQYREFFNNEILIQNLSPDGHLEGSNELVNHDPDSALQFHPVVASGFGNHDLVVWADTRNEDEIFGYEIFGQLYSRNGEKSGNNFLIRQGVDVMIQEKCAVAAHPNGGFVVLWEERNDAWQNMIIGQLISENGEITDEIIPVTDAGFATDCYGPDIGFDDEGNAVIIWASRADGSVWARRYGQSMNPIGASFVAMTGPEYTLDPDPGLAVSSNGNFAVVAEYQQGIFLQRFLANGSSLGEKILVSDHGSSLEMSSYPPAPAIAASSDGSRIVVAWSSDQYKPGFPKILSCVYEDGVLRSEVEIINEQDYQLNAHAYIWKNGLACNDEQIVYVWSENRGVRNLDVYCKVTDWNLTGKEEISLGESCLIPWPVPASEMVYLTDKPDHFTIYSISGRMINRIFGMEWDLRDHAGSQVPNGLYVIRNSRNEAVRVIVQRD